MTPIQTTRVPDQIQPVEERRADYDVNLEDISKIWAKQYSHSMSDSGSSQDVDTVYF